MSLHRPRHDHQGNCWSFFKTTESTTSKRAQNKSVGAFLCAPKDQPHSVNNAANMQQNLCWSNSWPAVLEPCWCHYTCCLKLQAATSNEHLLHRFAKQPGTTADDQVDHHPSSVLEFYRDPNIRPTPAATGHVPRNYVAFLKAFLLTMPHRSLNASINAPCSPAVASRP